MFHNVEFECNESIKLARLGYALANGLSQGDAEDIIHHCQPIAGWFPLETLSIESVLLDAEDRWQPNPELERLAEEACRRVWNKWDSTGDVTSAAQDWALDLIAEYAEADHIELIENNGD